MQTKSPFERITLIVLDGAGIGAMPDALEWGDAGSDTFGHILESRAVRLPNLQRIGLGNIRPLKGVAPADQVHTALERQRHDDWSLGDGWSHS